MLPVIAAAVVTRAFTGLQSVKLVVDNQLRDGNYVLILLKRMLFISCILLTRCAFRYHLPRSWLKPTQNLLVLFEELGGDPARITLVKRSVTTVCADISEYHPNRKNWKIESNGRTQELHLPKVRLHCGPGQSISSIKFASFGTPSGTCGSFQQGTCHSPTSQAILEKVLSSSPKR